MINEKSEWTVGEGGGGGEKVRRRGFSVAGVQKRRSHWLWWGWMDG